jgi:hypothetical protein
MPTFKAGECARKVADLSSLGESRNAQAHRRASMVHITEDQTFDWAATIIGGKRPALRFPPDPIPLAPVAKAVYDALAAERAIWPAEERDSIRIEILLLAGRVQGLEAGVYHAAGDGFAVAIAGQQHQLTWLRSSYGNAPAVLLVCGDLDAALSAGGLGYRSLLQRAGLLGHAMWLSAQAAGLTGSMSGRPHSQATALARQICGGLHHLLTVTLGGTPND